MLVDFIVAMNEEKRLFYTFIISLRANSLKAPSDSHAQHVYTSSFPISGSRCRSLFSKRLVYIVNTQVGIGVFQKGTKKTASTVCL